MAELPFIAMEYPRHRAFVSLVAPLVLAAVFAGCSGQDMAGGWNVVNDGQDGGLSNGNSRSDGSAGSSEPPLTPRNDRLPNENSDAGNGPFADGGGGNADGGKPPVDSNDGGPGTDSGPPGPVDPLAFVFPPGDLYRVGTGDRTIHGDHRGEGLVGGNPLGQPCLTCHKTGFTIAGSVYTDATGRTPLARAEIVLVGPGNSRIRVYTDGAGNFRLPGGPLAEGSYVGVRFQTKQRAMHSAIPNGNCNSCHRLGGGAELLHP
jgi:hypothetical protein